MCDFGFTSSPVSGESEYVVESCSCVGDSPLMGFSANCNFHQLAPYLCRLCWVEMILSSLLDEPCVASECTVCSQIPRTQWIFNNNGLFLFSV